MKRFIVSAAVIVMASSMPVLAQQQDAAFLQRALTALQTQRNLALDAQAIAEARGAGLAEELAKAQARIRELEAGAPEVKKE